MDLPAVLDRGAAPCHVITLQRGCGSGRVIWSVLDSAWAPTHFGPPGGDRCSLHLVAARTRTASELGRTRFRGVLGGAFPNHLFGHGEHRHTDDTTAELALDAARGAPRPVDRLVLEGGLLCSPEGVDGWDGERDFGCCHGASTLWTKRGTVRVCRRAGPDTHDYPI